LRSELNVLNSSNFKKWAFVVPCIAL
jgi:hypothetical protein